MVSGGLPFLSIARFSLMARQKRGGSRMTEYAKGEMHMKIELGNEPTKEAEATMMDLAKVVQ